MGRLRDDDGSVAVWAVLTLVTALIGAITTSLIAHWMLVLFNGATLNLSTLLAGH